MSVHLLRVQTESPAMTRSWYIKSCEFRARDYLRRGRSIDSYKRARGGEPTHSQDFDQNFELSDPLGCLDEVMARDAISVIMCRLTDRQRLILSLLLEGFGVRAVGGNWASLTRLWSSSGSRSAG